MARKRIKKILPRTTIGETIESFGPGGGVGGGKLRSLNPKKGSKDTFEYFGKTLYKTGVPKGQRKSGAGITSIPENKIILKKSREALINKPGYKFSRRKHKQEFEKGIKEHFDGDKEKFYRTVESADYDNILKGTSDKAINRVLDKMGLHTNEQIGVFQKNIQKASKRKHLKIVPSKKK
tara:strand:+ start:41 stop:577 length:537 start_codon:yes stop_codon:yes gene_type:complete